MGRRRDIYTASRCVGSSIVRWAKYSQAVCVKVTQMNTSVGCEQKDSLNSPASKVLDLARECLYSLLLVRIVSGLEVLAALLV